MSYNGEADDETEDSVTAIDACEDMLNVTAIDQSNPKEVVKKVLKQNYVHLQILMLFIMTWLQTTKD